MSVASWDYPIPFELSDIFGTLTLNAPITVDGESGFYLLNPQECNVRIGLRAPDTNLPQKDGQQLHRRFMEAYEMTLAVQLWESLEEPACDDLLQLMMDELLLHVRAFQDPPLYEVGPIIVAPPRVTWDPSGSTPERMIDKCRLSGDQQSEITIADNGVTQVRFTVKSPYPYAMDAAETTTALDAVLTNTGSAEFWPVIRVNGPTSGFTITNQTILDDSGSALAIVYDASQTGASSIAGGSYAEIDTFFETIYLNGDGANLKPGIVMSDSDFFPIQPGANDIIISGASANVLWQAAWA